jgi:flagellin
MSLTLNTNVAALQTQQYLNINQASMSNSLQQLSSGNRLSSPADDPADYAIAFKLDVKSASLSTAINNGNQGLAMLQVAQGGIETIGNILTQMKQIATEAASSNTDTGDLAALQTQITQFETEINNIAQNTMYSGTQVLMGGNNYSETAAQTAAGIDHFSVANAAAGAYSLTVTSTGGAGVTLVMTNSTGTNSQTLYVSAATLANDTAAGVDSTVNFTNFGISLQVNGALTAVAGGATQTITVAQGSSSFQYQVGSENATVDQINVSIANFQTSGGLGIVGDVNTWSDAQAFMGTIDTATTWLNGQAGSIGASQDEIQYQVSNLQNMNTNTQSAASTIKDTDYASAMSNFTQAQVASQAGVAMLTQANSIPQEILTLIKG